MNQLVTSVIEKVSKMDTDKEVLAFTSAAFVSDEYKQDNGHTYPFIRHINDANWYQFKNEGDAKKFVLKTLEYYTSPTNESSMDV